MSIGGAVHARSAPPAPCAPPPHSHAAAGQYVDPAFTEAKSCLLGRQPSGELISPQPTLLTIVGPSGETQSVLASSQATKGPSCVENGGGADVARLFSPPRRLRQDHDCRAPGWGRRPAATLREGRPLGQPPGGHPDAGRGRGAGAGGPAEGAEAQQHEPGRGASPEDGRAVGAQRGCARSLRSQGGACLAPNTRVRSSRPRASVALLEWARGQTSPLQGIARSEGEVRGKTRHRRASTSPQPQPSSSARTPRRRPPRRPPWG